ncbi:MAG: DNA recombination protein RmuC, partial [Pseudomonadota bacterium]
ATNNSQLESWKKDSEEIKELRQQNSISIEQKSTAIAEKQETEKKLLSITSERNEFLAQKEEAIKARFEAEKKLELIEQRMQEAEKRMQDWELQRSESLKSAKASILEAGAQLSSKLLEDHKREAEAAKKETETLVKESSDDMIEKVLLVTKSVAALQEDKNRIEKMTQTVWRTLASPAGAGSLAEIGLENSLKNFDLEAGRDYIMQYAINSEEAGRLRPDAVIFLPQDIVMVIDSKASKFLLEIAEKDNMESDIEILQNLKKTMNGHLNALSSKNYDSAIRSVYKESGKSDKISHILNVMYVPSENAVSHIKRADSEFIQKAEKAGIIIASPANLSGLLSLAKFNIGMIKQAENQATIVAKVQELMDSVINVLKHTDDVGKGLKKASSSFDSFANSINSRMLPKLRQLNSLGVKPTKNKELPMHVASLSGDMITIEAENAEFEEAV